MLGKLLKHEWKAVWKIPVLLIGILLAAAMMAGFTFHLPIWDSEWVGLPLSGVMMIITFYVAIIGVSLGITIYFAVRYYKNMFTDEGYLTHTLPVTARQLLLNKTITMSVWNLLAMIAVVVSIFVFFVIMFLSLAPKDGSFARELVEAVRRWPEALSSPYMDGFEGFCFGALFTVLAGAFSNTMMLIGAITLGQMVRKHRILGAVGAYFGFQIIIQILSTVVFVPMMIKMADSAYYQNIYELQTPFPVLTPFYFMVSGASLVVGIGLYFMSEYLIRHKLELE